jgi:F-type H+-transporting ATPase subunit gamma
MEAAECARERFEKGTYDRVELAFNAFKNAAVQIPTVQQFLPIVPTEAETADSSVNADYLFEPSKEFIVQELIPKALKLQVFKACLESNAAENGARMTAMDKATDNAGEMLKDLKLVYNRTRQAAITTEILEIVAGAEALAG